MLRPYVPHGTKKIGEGEVIEINPSVQFMYKTGVLLGFGNKFVDLVFGK